MFRLAFWAAVLIMLIPVEKDPKDLSTETALTSESITFAQGIYRDVSGFCDRNAETCEAGSQIGAVFQQKLKTGAKMLMTYLGDSETPPNYGHITTGSVKTD